MKWILLFAVSLLCWPASAQLRTFSPFHIAALVKSGGAGGAGDPCTGCTNETFEGVGYSVSGWTETPNAGGFINEDYATAPAPLVGSHSLAIRNPAFDGSFNQITVPTSAEVWMRFIFVCTNAVVNGTRIAFFADGGLAFQATIEIRSSGLRVVSGTANATTVNTLSANTTYYCWFHYQHVVGANNDVADVEFSTTKTRTGSGNGFASVNTGSPNADVALTGPGVWDVDFSGAVGGVIYDSWSFSNVSQPGDFP